MTGGTSPYMAIVLPREEKSLRPFFTFKRGRPGPGDGELAKRLEEWKGCFLGFMRKVRGLRGKCKGPAGHSSNHLSHLHPSCDHEHFTPPPLPRSLLRTCWCPAAGPRSRS